eukprot:4084523-Amphidinium_carterae.1
MADPTLRSLYNVGLAIPKSVTAQDFHPTETVYQAILLNSKNGSGSGSANKQITCTLARS